MPAILLFVGFTCFAKYRTINVHRFPHIDDVARTVSLYLTEELACILKYPLMILKNIYIYICKLEFV